MPRSPTASARTWFGIARCSDRVKIEGAIRPWVGTHDFAQLLVVDERGPLDWLILTPDRLTEDSVREHLSAVQSSDTRPPLRKIHPGSMTIAICSRERPQLLRPCLERLHHGIGNRYDVLVVDNAPLSNATEDVVNDMAATGMRIRRVLEPRPGLARARNLALRECTTDMVAFTDDDARPDVMWPTEILRGFSMDENVALVTGLAAPAEIENAAQALFESKVKWGENLQAQYYTMTKQSDYPWAFPYAAGNFGTGANFAVHRETILKLGGFDEALGAGTRCQGGEDLEMFVRVLREGYGLTYQPSAIVWHVHRSDESSLRKLLFGYGKGVSATALAEFLRPGKIDMLRGTMLGAASLISHRRDELDYGMPWQHLALEGAGVLLGPAAYMMERFRPGNGHRRRSR